jgi:hypothetical protein
MDGGAKEGPWPPLGRDVVRGAQGPSRDLVDPKERWESREGDPARGDPLSPQQTAERAMKVYTFTLLIEGPDVLEEGYMGALAEAGCDDALFGARGSLQYADFDRKAASFSEAVLGAIRAVEVAVPGLMVVRVEPDDLVTQSVIAERIGRTRESVRLFVEGKRGTKPFPEPVGWVTAKTSVWRWSEVADWFEQHVGEPVVLGGAPQFAAALNGALESRLQLARLSRIAERSKATDRASNLEVTPETVAAIGTLVDEGAEALQRELAHV